jgi:rhodanese-related sulfurtransferase
VLVGEGNAPKALLSGDTLFIGDVGRPDLLASRGSSATELAGALYDSLHTKLEGLPDELTLYPGHGAGSACGKSLSNETVSTLGAQRRTNPMLQPMSRERFVELATSGLGTPPRYFGYDAKLNRELRPVLEELYAPASRALSLSEVLALMHEGAVVLDTREPDEFAPRHLCGSINIGLSGKFATWVGSLLDPMRPIVLITPPEKQQESITRLARIGFDRVAGCLEDGIRALERAPEHARSFERIEATSLAQRRSAQPIPVLDVRAESERSVARIADSHFLPLPELLESTPVLRKDQPLAVHCAGGYRSTIACSLLEARGFTRLIDLRGGMSGWIASGQPVQRG